MAITLKSKAKTGPVLDKLGIPPHIGLVCAGLGLEVAFSLSAVRFDQNIEDDTTKFPSVGMASKSVSALTKNGEAFSSEAQREAAKASAYEAFKAALKSDNLVVPEHATDPVKKYVEVVKNAAPMPPDLKEEILGHGGTKKLKKAGGSDPEPIQPQDPAPGIGPEEQPAHMGNKVDLSSATQLYQPVHGSSNGSTYFTIAISPDLKVAARFKGSNLSMRVEGNLPLHSHRVKQAGFDIKSGYASMHIDTVNTDLGARTIGGILSALGQEYTTPMPVISKIEGKGT